tara:strand:+ start:101 stop:427 length:327 start_codon:yes stop_codon:yes gene_type:complete
MRNHVHRIYQKESVPDMAIANPTKVVNAIVKMDGVPTIVLFVLVLMNVAVTVLVRRVSVNVMIVIRVQIVFNQFVPSSVLDMEHAAKTTTMSQCVPVKHLILVRHVMN